MKLKGIKGGNVGISLMGPSVLEMHGWCMSVP